MSSVVELAEAIKNQIKYVGHAGAEQCSYSGESPGTSHPPNEGFVQDLRRQAWDARKESSCEDTGSNPTKNRPITISFMRFLFS